MTFDQLPYPHHVKRSILAAVETSYAWNWRSDVVEDLERHGFVKISHGGSNWSLTDKGRETLALKPVEWRYQRKEGWGDIWRTTSEDPSQDGFFETPEDWRVEPIFPVSKIENVYCFPNGMVAVTDQRGQQMPEFQGRYDEVWSKIQAALPSGAKVHR